MIYYLFYFLKYVFIVFIIYHYYFVMHLIIHHAIDTDPDENIMTLNRDLTRLQETLNSSLNEKKFSFLFQGLGFVLATILIRSAPRFQSYK